MYAAMGTLRLNDLRAGIERRWGKFFVDDADITSGLMPWESEVVSKWVRPADHVLVVGCGTGRDVLALAGMGCRVTGLEPAGRAVDIATRVLVNRGLTVPIIQGFFEDALLDSQFDVISFSWFCYSYIPQSRRRVEVLRKAARHLAPGGRILVSCRSLGEVPSSGLINVQRMVARLCGSDWQLEKGDRVATSRSSGDVFNYEHIFTPGELEAEAELAGLTIVFRSSDESVFVLRVNETSASAG
jgi:SAM-dependent methyltransferase